MDLSIKTETYGVDDQSWVGSRHGINNGVPATLDKSAFTAATHYPEGWFLSGLPLGRIDASGKYGPYADAATDGRGTLRGFLLVSVKAPDEDVDPVGAMLDHGKVVTSKLPVTVDAAGQADVAGRIIFL